MNNERDLTNATDAAKTAGVKTLNAAASPVIAESQLPQSDRDAEHMQGHWVLAKLGKRVLRPGGERLTKRMLEHTPIAGKHVVEFAPGLGRTTRLILNAGPAGYTGVDRDEQVVNIIGPLAASVGGTCVRADAARTGLADGSADAVVGEAMLTMQSERGKRAIIDEAHRILKPGGLYAIHEMGLAPDDLDESVKDSIRRDLARAIKVNARPLTAAEWRELLESAGFEVLWTGTEPMALLKMRRNLADEGVFGALRIMRNMLTHPDLRARVMQMRRVFNTYGDALTGIAFVARRHD